MGDLLTICMSEWQMTWKASEFEEGRYKLTSEGGGGHTIAADLANTPTHKRQRTQLVNASYTSDRGVIARQFELNDRQAYKECRTIQVSHP